jgi:MoaA/NifB/PqqE/SkfB family radical SAM enzyme
VKGKTKDNESSYRLVDYIDEVVERFVATGKDITFGFTGGEPLIYPGFLEICSKIVEKTTFRLALDTNLSIDIRPWTEIVPANRVNYIYSSLHIIERERIPGGIERFLDSVLMLQKRDYNTITNYVFYPPLIQRFPKDYDFFERQGVRIIPKAFKGKYEGRLYPDAYTDEERSILLKYNPDEAFAAKVPDFYGKRCRAGLSLLRINLDGEVIRCVGDSSSLGNVFTGFVLYEHPQPCNVHRCPCFHPENFLCEVDAYGTSACD